MLLRRCSTHDVPKNKAESLLCERVTAEFDRKWLDANHKLYFFRSVIFDVLAWYFKGPTARDSS